MSASHTSVTEELQIASTALNQKQDVEEDLRHCRVQNLELQARVDRLSQEAIDAVKKLDGEQKRSSALKQSDARQNALCQVPHPFSRDVFRVVALSCRSGQHPPAIPNRHAQHQ